LADIEGPFTYPQYTKEPCIFAKEPCPFVRCLQKSPISLQKSPVSLQKSSVSLQKNPVSLQKRPSSLQKSPVCLQESPVSLKNSIIYLPKSPTLFGDVCLSLSFACTFCVCLFTYLQYPKEPYTSSKELSISAKVPAPLLDIFTSIVACPFCVHLFVCVC